MRYLIPALAILFAGCGNNTGTNTQDNTAITPSVSDLNYVVRHVYKHDTSSYTEGLVFYNHQLFESSGAAPDQPQTRSIVGIEDMNTGKIDKKIELDRNKYFGEGIAFFKGKLYQLTYKNQTGFIYDAGNYKLLDSFRYSNQEGWALTTDSNRLIMSDGTSNLTFLDPSSLKPVGSLAVTENSVPVDSLNELEYIHGFIYANRYMKDYIVKIDPATGKVVGKFDLESLTQQEHLKNPNADVLNGIAYDPDKDLLYVTGKLWSGIYELSFSH
jgi:glutaminyl-peptide cyclotransferase